jgi:hypothetical protein
MSNELAILMQQNPALLQTGLDADTLAVAGGGGGNNVTKRISIKGGVFRKYAGGEEVGTIEDRSMNVVFIRMAHNASRMYYASSYKDGEKIVPTCWSSDSRTPDADVTNPPASSCDQCPYSVKNSVAGNGSACRLSWRTAVTVPGDPSGDIYQLVLPSTSCWQKEDNGKWGFRPYVQMLANNNIGASKIITKMQFDTKSPTPKLLFSPVGVLTPEQLADVEKQAKSQIADNYIKLTVYKPKEEGEAPAPQVAAPQAQPTPAPVAQATSDVQSDVVVEQPTLRAEPAPTQKPNDVSSIVKKWSVKT